jgi:hypothetical protein
MTDNGYEPVNEEFLLWLEHFKKNISNGKCVLTLDGHASHGKNIHVLASMRKNERPIILYIYQPTEHISFRHLT